MKILYKILIEIFVNIKLWVYHLQIKFIKSKRSVWFYLIEKSPSYKRFIQTNNTYTTSSLPHNT